MCQTERTSALSTPIPKALVATITSTSPAMKRRWAAVRSSALHPGVVGERAQRPASRRSRRPRRCPCGCRSRRSPGGSPGRRGPPRAAPAAAPSSPCPPAARRRRRGWAGRSRSGPRAGRASRSGRRSRRHRLGRRRRAGHHRRPAEPLGDLRQAQVVGPEVVPPLRDAVRLVDGEQVDAALRQGVEEDASSRSAPASSRRSAPRRRAPGRGRRAPPRRSSPRRSSPPGARPPVSRRHWSFISAISGLTTIVRSSVASPGSW